MDDASVAKGEKNNTSAEQPADGSGMGGMLARGVLFMVAGAVALAVAATLFAPDATGKIIDDLGIYQDEVKVKGKAIDTGSGSK